MKIFFLRLFFILAVVFFEFSFFDILFPQMGAPLVLIASIVAWVLASGFSAALFMIVPLALLFDVLSVGMPGALTLYAVPLAYVISFLSRRLLVERRGFGMVLYAFFVGISALGYVIFNSIFFQRGGLSEIVIRNALPGIAVWTLFIFVGAYQVIRRFEKYIGYLSQSDFLKVK